MKLAAKRHAEYLAEKQKILEQALSDDSDGEASGDDQQNNNVRTADWVKDQGASGQKPLTQIYSTRQHLK